MLFHNNICKFLACNLMLYANFLLLSSCKVDGSKPLMGVSQNTETSTDNNDNSTQNSTSANNKTNNNSTTHNNNSALQGLEIPSSPPLEGSGEALLLTRLAYTTSYNPQTRNPNWVAWHLTAEHTNGDYKRDKLRFAEDEDVPQPRATNADYVQSGYDRGHMMPSGDCRWSEQAQRESFLYTNCCPQLHSLNAGDWNELEASCRQWAEKYGQVWIACGPIYLNKKHKTIGKNKVVVPEAFFKVVLTLDNGRYKSIGFIYRNEKSNKPKSSYVNTVDQVERITGYDFFSALPDDIENEIEAVADLEDW